MSDRLITAPNLPDMDAAFRSLVEAHRTCADEAASAALNARLVLILANHIGDPVVLAEAIALASKTSTSEPLAPA